MPFSNKHKLKPKVESKRRQKGHLDSPHLVNVNISFQNNLSPKKKKEDEFKIMLV